MNFMISLFNLIKIDEIFFGKISVKLRIFRALKPLLATIESKKIGWHDSY